MIYDAITPNDNHREKTGTARLPLRLIAPVASVAAFPLISVDLSNTSRDTGAAFEAVRLPEHLVRTSCTTWCAVALVHCHFLCSMSGTQQSLLT